MKVTALHKKFRQAEYFGGDGGVSFAQDDSYDTLGEDQDFTHSPDDLAASILAHAVKARRRAPRRKK